MGADVLIGGTFVVYVLVMLVVGFVAYRRTANLADYILGGRRLGSFATALSAQASDMSGWLLLGLPGAAYVSGLGVTWVVVGLFVGTYLNWLLVAARLRDYTARAGDSLTVSEYLERRFHDRTHLLSWISGVFILLFFLIYTTSGMVAGGKLFESVFGVSYRWAVILGALAVISYTCLGGFIAVCWTDCVQGLLMLFALVFLPLVVLGGEGGYGSTVEAMRNLNPELLNPLTDLDGKRLGVIGILSGLGWGLGYFGQPHILCRFMAIRSSAEIPRARRMAMGWVALCMGGAFLVGLVGIRVFADAPLAAGDTEKVFIRLVQAFMHPIPAGICLAAILAAIMSTADSQLLVSSSVLAQDFYRDIFHKDAEQHHLVWVGRGAVALIAVLAAAMAMNPESSVLGLVAYAWGGFGAAFGPILIMSLFWPRTTRNGALAGILVGGTTVILWRHQHGGLFELYEIIPGFIFSLAAIVIVSLLGRPPAHPEPDGGGGRLKIENREIENRRIGD